MKTVSDQEEYAEITARDGLSVVMYSTQFCAPCRAIKPKYKQLADSRPGISFFTVDPQTIACNISAVPYFRVFENGRIIFDGVGYEAFRKLENGLVEPADE